MDVTMKTIGLISPNFSEETLADVYQILPKDVRIVGRDLDVAQYVDSEFQRVERKFAGIVGDLARQPLDFLMITGELFLSYKGPGSDRLILDMVKGITPVAASTVLTAVIHAHRALGMKRVVMASPFAEAQDARLIKFLTGDGIEVMAHKCLGYDNSNTVWKLSPQTGYDLAAALLRDHPDADGLYMPCNKWRITSIIDRLEREFGKPVVTNTQAWTWEALRSLGFNGPTAGYGQLLVS